VAQGRRRLVMTKTLEANLLCWRATDKVLKKRTFVKFQLERDWRIESVSGVQFWCKQLQKKSLNIKVNIVVVQRTTFTVVKSMSCL
jgi:hypothetical protein